LATYESNFNQKYSLDSRMERILKNVQKTKTLINKEYRIMDIQYRESGVNFDKIDQAIEDELIDQNLLHKIDQPVAKREKVVGMLSEVQIHHIFTNL
jgi:Zn-finger domain-containing protein